MTFHRFMYKVVWKSKVIILLIFLCGLIAILTTLLHGNFLQQTKQKSAIQPGYDNFRAKVNDEELGENEVRMLQEVGNGGVWKDEKAVFKGFVDDAKKKALEMLHIKKNHRIEIDPSANDVALRFQGQERKAKRPKDKPLKPFHNSKIAYDVKNPPESFGYWIRSEEKFCDGKFSGYFNEFAQVRSVIFDQAFCKGRKGGENIEAVLLQAEEDEFYTYDMGCMKMECDDRPNYFFNNKNHLNDLLFSLSTKDIKESDVQEQVTEGFTLLVTRYEYANIYHTMTDWYNAFLLMNFFNKTQAETNILIVDGHPKGALDPVWPVLFNSSRRMSQLQPQTLYKELTFNILGYNSHFLDHSAETIPLIDEFSQFFLDSYRLPYNDKKLNCDKVSVLFIWRRDYLAHPRNPTGEVSRKIQNERELIEFLQKQYPEFHVKGVQIDLFDMQQQLKYVSQADVLIGMHGAGLTHALFLPKHAGLIELIPNYWSAAMEHFMAIARWKLLKYERWVNTDPHNESPNQETTVPTQVLNVLFRSLLRQMGCLPHLQEDISTHRASQEG